MEETRDKLSINTLTNLYQELDTLKWQGQDRGWDLAIEAVRSYISEEINKINGTTEKEHKEEVIYDLPQGTIVKATRFNNDFTWQGVYYGKVNDKYLIDFNGTHCMVADKVEIIPTLTKKEAKQKVSELFANPKNITSQKVRDIIDLIKG